MTAAMLLIAGSMVATPDWPQTKAEISRYTNTSSYEDVMFYLHSLQANGAPIIVQPIGESASGKAIPLVIVSKPTVANPSDAMRSGKPVVYIQANIHAGEVEGKEAVLVLLREIAQGDKDHLLDKLILLVTPIYNIDGNDKFGAALRNRPSQDGPDPVGERANGQGMDLNRDCIKAESNEMRAVLKHVYTAWDPDVVMDLHTTNGTRHNFKLTYSPPLNPNTPTEIMKYSRDQLLPGLRKSLKDLNLFDYGNAEGSGANRAWRTFGQEGRYVTNYVGLRNRIAVLSEAASFQPFRVRIDSTLVFVKGVLKQIAKDASKVTRMTRDADNEVIKWGNDPAKAPSLGVRFDMARRGKEVVELEKLSPGETVNHGKAPKNYESVTMPVFDRFVSTKTSRFPAAYLFPASERKTAELLVAHGIVVETLTKEWRGKAESFQISEVVQAGQAFQGHRLIRLEGTYSSTDRTFPIGSFVVRTAQPLGILAFHVLEPESLDGACAWGFLADAPKASTAFPICKSLTPINTPSWRLRIQ